MSISFKKVTKGSSLTGSAQVNGVSDLTGWEARLQLRDYNDRKLISDVDHLLKNMSDDNSKFLFALSSDDLNIDPGLYVIGIEMSNQSTSQSAEIHKGIEIVKDWVY